MLLAVPTEVGAVGEALGKSKIKDAHRQSCHTNFKDTKQKKARGGVQARQ